jgi:DNA-directed RNA polymerase subunit RPC12/RpoP
VITTKLDDYKKPNGDIDWNSYHAAQKASGEVCSQCGNYLVWGKGHPDRCGSCKALDDSGEVSHHSTIRCPACGHQMEASDHELYEDGAHDVVCGECDHEFEVEVSISFTFTSPARKEEEAES